MANEIKKININNIEYDLQDTISGYAQIGVTNNTIPVSSGIILGTIELNGQEYNIVAPSESSSSQGLDVSLTSTNLNLMNNQGNGI